MLLTDLSSFDARLDGVPSPNRTFAALVFASVALIGAIGWSTHHLLVAGAPGFVDGGLWPELQCLLVPGDRDAGTHLVSYIFLATIGASTASSLLTLIRQHQQTRRLLRNCLAVQAVRQRKIRALARTLRLDGRIDVVDSDAQLAFCYGYVRPRILISTGLVSGLSRSELECLLLHEREHLRQRDPLKVAIGRLLVGMLFFMPLIGALYRRYLVEKELAADRAAVNVQGQSRDLAGALLHLLEAGSARPAPSVGGDEALAARIAVLLGEPIPFRPHLRPAHVAGSLMIAIVALLPLVSPLAHAAPSAVSGHDVVDGCHAPRADASALSFTAG